MAWPRRAKIAFIGSHSVRKSNAVHAFASTIGRAGRSVEVGREVVRFNPLGLNEGASPEAQLWVLISQVQQELELAHRADVLVTDRSVVDNFAYYLRVTGGEDPFGVEPLIRRWADTYDLSVRLLPDVGLLADGVRSTNDAFRDEIEAILDRILPVYLADERCLTVPASQVTAEFDWLTIAERLAALVGQPLVDGQMAMPLSQDPSDGAAT
jgi:nicotinamide riboside kinase